MQIGEGTHHLLTGNERQKSYLPECLYFKEMTLKSLRRHFWMLSKVATLRKGSSVVYNQVFVGINSKLFCQYSLEKKQKQVGCIHTYTYTNAHAYIIYYQELAHMIIEVEKFQDLRESMK